MPALVVIILCLCLSSCGTSLHFSKNIEVTTSQNKQLRLNEMNGYAAEDFLQRYPDGNNAAWFRTGYGYLARFAAGKLHAEVYYNQHGAFTKEVTYYDEENIPEAVETIMNKKFPAYSITAIAAITDSKTSLYQVSIQHDETFKTIAISGNEVDVLYEMKNGVIAYR